MAVVRRKKITKPASKVATKPKKKEEVVEEEDLDLEEEDVDTTEEVDEDEDVEEDLDEEVDEEDEDSDDEEDEDEEEESDEEDLDDEEDDEEEEEEKKPAKKAVKKAPAKKTTAKKTVKKAPAKKTTAKKTAEKVERNFNIPEDGSLLKDDLINQVHENAVNELNSAINEKITKTDIAKIISIVDELRLACLNSSIQVSMGANKTFTRKKVNGRIYTAQLEATGGKQYYVPAHYRMVCNFENHSGAIAGTYDPETDTFTADDGTEYTREDILANDAEFFGVKKKTTKKTSAKKTTAKKTVKKAPAKKTKKK